MNAWIGNGIIWALIGIGFTHPAVQMIAFTTAALSGFVAILEHRKGESS